MAAQPDRPIQISLTVESSQTLLLQGLEVWLQLGLISDAQVKQVGRSQLACPIPIPATVAAASPPLNDFAPVKRAPQSLPALSTPRPPNRVAEVLQSFMAEVSVLWLLFLGVFLVVVSSAVLAATQWQNVSIVGQYAILFTYTLIFWGISAWAKQRRDLQLTARMLQITTLLIIPVNFWMMDGLKLWQSGAGWLLAAIAALILTGILVLLLRSQAASRLVLANAIGLSWLHWGWAVGDLPVIATYVGTVGTALVVYQTERQRHPARAEAESPSPTDFLSRAVLGTIAIAFATLLLVGRAILAAKVPIDQLGLAMGICGWLLCWLARRDDHRLLWNRSGLGLLLAGWLVTVGTNPWQAIGVSGLGLGLLGDRLQRHQRQSDLTALFMVGLQSCWLLWRVVPADLQQTIIELGYRWAGSEFMPGALIGLGGFPYVILTVALATSLRQRQQPRLATHAEGLSLILGSVLMILSLGNPLLRALNLLLSLATLAIGLRNLPQVETALIYLTHLVGLGAIASGLRVIFPDWQANPWFVVTLGVMAIEWIACVGSRWQRWRQSAWHLGIGLAAIAFTLLLVPEFGQPERWALLWLVVPVMLTWLTFREQFTQPQLAGWLSAIALLAIQTWTYANSSHRLISLGVATVVMLLNTQQLQAQVAAVLTVGFGLGFTNALIWQLFSNRLTLEWWATVWTVIILALWLLWSGLKPRSSRLLQYYANATDGWAIGLALPILLVLLAYNLGHYGFGLKSVWQLTVAAAGLTAAFAYRVWQQPRNWNTVSVALAGELLLASSLATTAQPLDWLAIGTLALGWLTQWLGDRLFYHRSTDAATPTRFLSSYHVIPLGYACLGLLLGHHQFTATTGLYTLTAAAIGLGVGRRHVGFKPIAILSLLGSSLAAYELLLYQLSQASGGEAGDGITLLAGLGVAIAIAYRLLGRWLHTYTRLADAELRLLAHLHWSLGSVWALLALANRFSLTGTWLWLGIMSILALYALVQGRSRRHWTYAGIVELGIAIGYLLHRQVAQPVLVPWAATIACGFALAMYYLPWARWGWAEKPWKQSAQLLPGIIVAITAGGISIQSLLIVAAVYAWLAKAAAQVRLSYISLLLVNWAGLRLLAEWLIVEPLWYACLWGASLLYIAQVDPALQAPSDRDQRHLLRCFATGLICLTALYQAEVGLVGVSAFVAGGLAIGFSLAFVLAGIALRIRAFLYIGTIGFILRVLRQVQVFLSDYSILLWAIGIAFGSLLIWIALTFEARRSQLIALMQYWLTELELWD